MFWTDLLSYGTAHLGGALAVAFPMFFVAMIFRRSAAISTLVGAVCAAGLSYASQRGDFADAAIGAALAALLGAGFGMLASATVQRTPESKRQR